VTQTEAFIREMEGVLAPHFALGQIYHGQAGAMRLAREVGCALADSPDDEADDIIQALYGRLLVRFTLGRPGGVPVDARPWFDEMRRALEETRAKRKLREGRVEHG
jgi:hypothetical protein